MIRCKICNKVKQNKCKYLFCGGCGAKTMYCLNKAYPRRFKWLEGVNNDN